MLALNHAATERIEDYLRRLGAELSDLPEDSRDAFLARVRAEIEVDMELHRTRASDDEALDEAMRRLGDPHACANRLRAQIAPLEEPESSPVAATVTPSVKPCRACANPVSRDATMCPRCGAPFPARTTGNISGYEWKSNATLFGWPLVHVAFGRDKNRKLRVAKGIVAIGQFAIGAITIAQFGVGFVFGVGQFMLAPIAIGQFAGGLFAVGQFGLGLLHGIGQISTGLLDSPIVRIVGRR